MGNINLDIDIKRLQKVELEILIECDRICRKHHLKYQLFSGTLLGAVRHKGFIPWDDDVDVCMLRKDYNTFLNICKKDLDERYFYRHMKQIQSIYIVLQELEKQYITHSKAWAGIEMHHGIFIDVFPMDKILPDRLIGKIQYHCIYPLRKLKRLKVKYVCLNSNHPIKRQVKLFIRRLLKPFSMQWFNRLETKILCMFKNKETMYSTTLSEGDRDVYHSYKIKNDVFYDTIEMDFEGYKFLAPRNYEEVLTNNFGDYIPPPIEEQQPHHGIIELDFDTTTMDIIKNKDLKNKEEHMENK